MLDVWLVASLFLVITSDAILDEVERALRRPYFASRLPEVDGAAYLELLRRSALVVVPRSQVTGVARDPDDDHVLATAVDGGVDCLVTGDEALLELSTFRGVRIVRARELREILAEL